MPSWRVRTWSINKLRNKKSISSVRPLAGTTCDRHNCQTPKHNLYMFLPNFLLYGPKWTAGSPFMSTYVKTGSWWVSWGAYFWPHSTPNWVPNKVKNLTSKSRTSQNRAVSGPLRTEYSVKYGAVSLIFLISGISLKTDSVLYTFQQYKLHLFIQAFTFVLVPIFAQLFTQLLTLLGVNSWVLKGWVALNCNTNIYAAQSHNRSMHAASSLQRGDSDASGARERDRCHIQLSLGEFLGSHNNTPFPFV